MATAMDSIRFVLPSTAQQLTNVKKMVGYSSGENSFRRGKHNHRGQWSTRSAFANKFDSYTRWRGCHLL